MKCEHCNGFIAQLWDDKKCVNCGRAPKSAAPKLDFIFSIELKSPIQGYRSEYRDYDLNSVSQRTTLRQFMNKCLGSGMRGLEIRSKKITNNSTIDKARCRVCNESQFLTNTSRVIAHKPSKLIQERIQAALDSIKMGVEAIDN